MTDLIVRVLDWAADQLLGFADRLSPCEPDPPEGVFRHELDADWFARHRPVIRDGGPH